MISEAVMFLKRESVTFKYCLNMTFCSVQVTMNMLSIPLNESLCEIGDDVRIQGFKRQKIKTGKTFRRDYENTAIHHHFFLYHSLPRVRAV